MLRSKMSLNDVFMHQLMLIPALHQAWGKRVADFAPPPEFLEKEIPRSCFWKLLKHTKASEKNSKAEVNFLVKNVFNEIT